MEITKAAESAVLELQVGKAYRTRGGEKAIVEDTQNVGSYKFDGHVGGRIETWTADGRAYAGAESMNDLIAPWQEPAPAVDLSNSKADQAASFLGKTAGFLTALIAYTAFSLMFVSFLNWDVSWIEWKDVRVSAGITFLVMLWFRIKDLKPLKAGAQ